MNLSLQKEFRIRESISAQFSAEATDLLNNVQLRPAVTASTGGTFAALSAAQKAQGIQSGMIQNESFGTYTMSTFDARQIELRLRFRF